MKAPKDGNKNSRRCLRVGEAVRRSLSALFMRADWQGRELERLKPLFTEVKMSADLSHARVYFTATAAGAAEVLRVASPRIRRRLAPMLNLQKLPKLDFRYDETFEKARVVNSLLGSPHVSRDLRAS